MKEYKIVRLKVGLFTKDNDHEQALNNEARNGWHLVNIIFHGGYLKAFMEKDK